MPGAGKSLDDIAESFEEKIKRFEKESGIQVPRFEDEELTPEVLSEAEAEDALKVLALQDKIKGEQFAEKLPGMDQEGQQWALDYEAITGGKPQGLKKPDQPILRENPYAETVDTEKGKLERMDEKTVPPRRRPPSEAA